jgi:C4-dicarboxylate-binding protein DctP
LKGGEIMKRNLILSLTILLACVFTISPVLSPTGAAEKVYTIKAGHVEPTGTALDKGWHTFKQYVEKASKGRIKMDVYPACQLGDQGEMFKSMKMGTIQIAQGDEGNMATWYEPFFVMSIPYLFPNEAVAVRFYESKFFQENLNEGLIKKQGIRLLGAACYGFRCFTNNVRPIRTPQDIAGLKMRVMETPLFVKLVKALGASPTVISFAELYAALQQGVADGQENPPSVIYDMRFHEVQKYLTLSEHVCGTNTMLINEKFFQSLPEELRVMLIEGAQLERYVETGGRAYENNVTVLETLTKAGTEIYVPTLQEKEQFKKLAQPAVVEWVSSLVGKDFVDQVIGEVERIEADIVSEASPAK